MKKLLIMAGLAVALLQAAPTYFSLTTLQSKQNVTGFRDQVMAVPLSDEYGHDIELSYSATVPHNAGLISPAAPEEAFKLNLSDIDWCTNGTMKMKIYVPPHLTNFKVALQYLPINYGLGFATFRPTGTIDEKNAKDKTELGASAYYDKLWNKGETVVFTVNETADISFYPYIIDKYNIDTSKGGYLYLSFTQADKILKPARAYDSRYAMSAVVQMDFKHPFTETMRNEVLSAIPDGLDEPYEAPEHVLSRECSAPYEYDLVTEVGAAIPPEELCANKSGTYVNSTCYYLPADQAKYDCEVTDGDVWKDGRCVRQPEIDCNALPDKQWYVAGNTCLYNYDNISTDPLADMTPKSLVIDANDTAYRMHDYEANAEGWSTQFAVQNNNNVNASAYNIKVIKVHNSDDVSLGSFSFTVQPNDVWKGRLFFNDGTLTLEGAADSADAGTVLTAMSSNEVNGSVLFTPENAQDIATTRIDMKYGVGLSWNGQVDISPEEQACIDKGGIYSAETGDCYEAAASSSSVNSSSSSHVSSSSSSAAAVSSVSASEQEKACIAAGGVYSADTGDCYGAVVSSNSSSSLASSSSAAAVSSVSASDQEKACEDAGGVYSADTGDCYGASISDGASSSSSAGNISEQKRIASYLAGKTFSIDGWFAQHDFAESSAAFDWVFVTPKGSVYQLHGTKPNADSVFGWKKVYIKVDGKDRLYAMANIGDWDQDGSDKFDWILVDLQTHKVDKLAGVNDNGTFKYLKDGIDINVKIDGENLIFTAKPGQ